MTIGEMDPKFEEKWANNITEDHTPGYENTLTLDFEIESDMDYVLEFIADSCRKQEINGRVICIQGTLRTDYEYEHDGT